MNHEIPDPFVRVLDSFSRLDPETITVLDANVREPVFGRFAPRLQEWLIAQLERRQAGRKAKPLPVRSWTNAEAGQSLCGVLLLHRACVTPMQEELVDHLMEAVGTVAAERLISPKAMGAFN